MKYIKRILCLLIVFVLFIPLVYADTDKEKNLVNIYLFYSDSCVHCASEKELLNEIIQEYDNVKVYKYEVSNNDENRGMMEDIASMLDVEVSGVPFTVIANKPYYGFNKYSSKRVFLGTIDYYLEHGYVDTVGEYLGNIELPSYDLDDDSDFYNYLDNYGNYELSLLGFKVNTKDLDLNITSIIMGILDGVNIFSLILLFLMINIFFRIKNKKRLISFCLVYLGVSFVIYLLSMLFGLSLEYKLLNIILGFILFGLFIVCNSKIINKIFDKDNALVIIGSSIVLSLILVIFKLSYNMEMPNNFMNVLYINNLNIIECVLNIFIYLVFFFIDDLIIMFGLVMCICSKKISENKLKIFNVILIFIILLYGLLRVLK